MSNGEFGVMPQELQHHLMNWRSGQPASSAARSIKDEDLEAIATFADGVAQRSNVHEQRNKLKRSVRRKISQVSAQPEVILAVFDDLFEAIMAGLSPGSPSGEPVVGEHSTFSPGDSVVPPAGSADAPETIPVATVNSSHAPSSASENNSLHGASSTAEDAAQQAEAEPAEPDLSTLFFAPFDYGRLVDEPQPGAPIHCVLTDGQVSLRWSAPSEQEVTVYRVVQDHGAPPVDSPDAYEPVTTTLEQSLHCADTATHQAVTHFAVWAHSGTTIDDAVSQQPELVGSGFVVRPVQELSTTIDHARHVVGAFQVLPSEPPARVMVRRFTGDVTPQITRAFHQIPAADCDNSTFLDTNPLFGETCTYAVYTVVSLPDGTAAESAPTTVTACVAGPGVTIALQVENSTEVPGALDISWPTPAHGSVKIYGIDLADAVESLPPVDRELSADAAAVLQITEKNVIQRPVQHAHGTSFIKNYVAPQEWVRFDLVAGHWCDDDTVQIGQAVTHNRPKCPTDAVIQERVHSQIVSFAWPGLSNPTAVLAGANGQAAHSSAQMYEVRAYYQLPQHNDADDTSRGTALQSITYDEYVKLGGMFLNPLPPQGAVVHLYGVLSENGKPYYSEKTTVEYPGLYLFEYRVKADKENPDQFTVFARSNMTVPPVELVLVAQKNRVPISAHNDGVFIDRCEFSETSLGGAQGPQKHPLLTFTRQDILSKFPHLESDDHVYVRLFAISGGQVEPHLVAVIDPPSLAGLRISASVPQTVAPHVPQASAPQPAKKKKGFFGRRRSS